MIHSGKERISSRAVFPHYRSMRPGIKAEDQVQQRGHVLEDLGGRGAAGLGLPGSLPVANRAAVEQSVRAAVSNNWPDAARTLLRGMKSSGSILGLPLPALRGEGIAQDQAEILSHFPEAMRYAASKVGQNVNLSEPISQDVVNVRQAIDVAAQSNRGMLENSVKAAQSGTWEDAAYSLCASINSPWSCVAVFPAAIQLPRQKLGKQSRSETA